MSKPAKRISEQIMEYLRTHPDIRLDFKPEVMEGIRSEVAGFIDSELSPMLASVREAINWLEQVEQRSKA